MAKPGDTRPRRFQVINRAALKRLAILAIMLGTLIAWAWFTMIQMPGESYRGQLPPLTPREVALREALRRDVDVLASQIGPRNYEYYKNLTAAAGFLRSELTQAGYTVRSQSYQVEQQTYENLEVEILGRDRPDEIVVVGGHYDTAFTSPGANDNGTGASATLELARLFAGRQLGRTLRFVEFVNEEPPFFWTEAMGSLVYAKRCKARNEKIVAMLSLETMGYYSDEVGSQKYPPPLGSLYPLQGNFIGFVGNLASAPLVKEVVGLFRQYAQFPSEGGALPGELSGVGWSDQWAFWQQGYPGVMVTDTAPFRYPDYHTEGDTPDKVNFDRLARVVAGLEDVLKVLVRVTNSTRSP